MQLAKLKAAVIKTEFAVNGILENIDKTCYKRNPLVYLLLLLFSHCTLNSFSLFTCLMYELSMSGFTVQFSCKGCP